MSRPANFDIEQLLVKDILRLKISGHMSEQSHFPTIDPNKVHALILDLEKINFVNSFGIQRWVKWLRDIQRDAPRVSMTIEKVSSATVRSMAFIREFLPRAIVVDSVYVPLECPKCDSQPPDLLVSRMNPRNISPLIPACADCGGALVPETPIDQYLWFWKNP